MLEMRKHPNVRTSVHITGLGLRLPMNGQWVSLARFPFSVLEESDNLKTAFENNLVELKVIDEDYRSLPSWFLLAYADNVRVPKEILEGKEQDTFAALSRLKRDAHPLMLAILRTGLLQEEVSHQDRSKVVSAILSLVEDVIPLTVEED